MPFRAPAARPTGFAGAVTLPISAVFQAEAVLSPPDYGGLRSPLLAEGLPFSVQKNL